MCTITHGGLLVSRGWLGCAGGLAVRVNLLFVDSPLRNISFMYRNTRKVLPMYRVARTPVLLH